METHVIRIKGIVQGVGFRPFVYNLATSYGLKGYVRNDTRGVTIEVQGDRKKLKSFEQDIIVKSPPRSKISELSVEIKTDGEVFEDFKIVFSKEDKVKTVPVSPDLFVCNDCLKELFDPEDRRYLYPFINCTNCGPRFTIVKNLPYDRKNTTMSVFKMCNQCQVEYNDPTNRRFHAQPNACFRCGPYISLIDNNGSLLIEGKCAGNVDKIFKKLREFMLSGKIVAIKGIGGFHLSCDAENEEAVKALRNRKYREDKPFAVMFPDIESVKRYCHMGKKEEELLLSVSRPIVLLRKIEGNDLAYSVAPGNKYLGVMLPYTPIHYLLMKYTKRPLVMTSGNLSDEPIAYKNDDALRRLRNIADYFLIHNREIHIRCDDSVTRIWGDREYIIRKSRGYIPGEMSIDWEFKRPVLACGPEQKNTFAFGIGKRVYMSHHIGDMDNYRVYESYIDGVEHFKRLYDIEPEIIVYDMHPEYLSSKFAVEYDGVPDSRKIAVQHHFAHAVSCMVDNNIRGPVIAVTFDGTGYGDDGTVWGGEILVADFSKYERIAHFDPVVMPGGISAIKNPWQMAMGYLYQVFGDRVFERKLPIFNAVGEMELKNVLRLIERGTNSPVTTSCGRLFDAVAAMSGLRFFVNYEGQAAVEFEQSIDVVTNDRYSFYFVESGGRYLIKWDEMIKQVVFDVESGVGIGMISAKFHNGLAEVVSKVVGEIAEDKGFEKVVLSGGVFMNIFLLDALTDKLKEKGLQIYTHSRVPANDGGIALGQLVAGDAMLKERSCKNVSCDTNESKSC